MKICPPTITILSFLFVAVGVISTAVHVWQFNISRPTFLEEAGIYAVGALAVVAGIYMLRGRNWARWLALGWICFHVIVAAFNQPLGLVIHVIFVALLAWFLFRPESQQWFKPQPAVALAEFQIPLPDLPPAPPDNSLPPADPPPPAAS